MSYFNRTISYLKRNGLRDTYYAVCERIDKKGMDKMQKKANEYHKPEDANSEYLGNNKTVNTNEFNKKYVFSIIVPTYETDQRFLQEMVDSVLKQKYDKVQLVIADASVSDKVKTVINSYKDNRIVYIKLKENAGISENTNAALDHAEGDYVGLLDHDDTLDPNALYEIMKCLQEHDYDMVYTDEDKMSEDGETWFEPNFKPDFNLDYLLSNNYICHFTVLKADLIKKLRFRSEYDGAQDYDLFLRAVYEIDRQRSENTEKLFSPSYMKQGIGHIPKILYHWRAHGGSTADNPESKRYAYEAGKRAIEDFMTRSGWKAVVSHTKHLGYYKISYDPDLFTVRKDVIAVCGRVISHGRVIEGPVMDGQNLFIGMHEKYSGYQHRANMMLDVESAPEGCIHQRNKSEMVTGITNAEDSDEHNVVNASNKDKNGRIVYLPEYIVRK